MSINKDIADFLVDETPDKFKINSSSFKSEKDLNSALNACRTILSYLKIWFKVLSQSDTGSEFIAGVSTQVNLIHNLTFQQDIDITKTVDNITSNDKLQEWKSTLDNKQKKILKYVEKHINLFSHTEKWIKNHKNKLTAYVRKMFGIDEWKIVNKYKRLTKFATNVSQSSKRILNRIEQDDLLSNSIAGKFLQRIMNQNNTEFQQFKKSDKNKDAYLQASYQTIAIVFSQCEIKVDGSELSANYGKDTAQSGAILAFIKSHQKIKIGKDITFRFKYNNNTQYGDNDTYNQWIDNRNILIVNNNRDFADINWATLLKNAVLIDAEFSKHKFSL